MEQKEISESVVTAVAIVILVVISSLIVGAVLSSSSLNCVDVLNSGNSTVLTNSLDTLSPIGDGITSYAVTTYNDTWIDCDGVDDYVYVIISESKATVSLWFKNSTTDWTSIIRADGNNYIDGSLDAGWDFLPYYTNADTLTFCKTNSTEYLNVSIDTIRVYEQSLNSTEVTEVYNYGR